MPCPEAGDGQNVYYPFEQERKWSKFWQEVGKKALNRVSEPVIFNQGARAPWDAARSFEGCHEV